MSKKKLLSENQIRRFQGLAGIPAISEMHCPSGEREEDVEEGMHDGARHEDEEELDEQSRTNRPDRARPEGGRRLDEEDEDELEEELKNPDKADLDDDGKLSGYEKKRGKAIEKSMKKEELKETLKKILRKHL